jgi:hypothetical protein
MSVILTNVRTIDRTILIGKNDVRILIGVKGAPRENATKCPIGFQFGQPAVDRSACAARTH